MKDVNIFIPEPGNTRAILAVSALARAMKEDNKVAILRCVWRQGQNNVVIGVLSPNISNKSSIPDSFYFNVLPFAEDVREFQFPSFSNLPSSCQPSKEQQEAADEFVNMLDLTSPGKEEFLLPDFTPNPILERFYRFLELKSKNPDAPIPPLDPTLRKITEPDPELLAENQRVIEGFRRSFELKDNPKLKKSQKRLLRGMSSGSHDYEERLGYIKISPSAPSSDPMLQIKAGGIGDTSPVEDFEAMLSRRDSPEWVERAIKEMKNKTFDLVEDSFKGDNYPKALECLLALRKGCILEQEPKQFNNFLGHLCRFCQEKDLKSFCDFLASKGVTLISKTEAPDSDVSDEEASSFLVKTEPKAENDP
uniref:Ku domain-containing protein n=1 Tax=Kalanchoe fedtschenkoi TaxID=63787 RepID=A0A7N0T050_KALFE